MRSAQNLHQNRKNNEILESRIFQIFFLFLTFLFFPSNSASALGNDVEAQTVNGIKYIAEATTQGLYITSSEYGGKFRTAYDGNIIAVNITEEGQLYYLTELDDLRVVYSIGAIEFNANSQFRYSYLYDETTIPALWTSAVDLYSLDVTQSTSSVDSKSNTVFVGTSEGLVALHEKQGDESNGAVKYYNSDYISELMIGDVRGMWGLMDNSSNATISDLSVNGNDLTSSVNTNTIDSSGVRGLGVTLSTEYASIADNSDFDFSASDDFSISIWAKHDSISANSDYLLTKAQAGTNGGYKLYMDSDGDFVFAIDDDATWGPDDSVGSTLSKNYDDNRWHHIVAVKEGLTGIYLYVDGALVASDTALAATGTLVNDDSLYLGVDDDGASGNWVGNIDELMITAEALDLNQIKNIYQLGLGALQFHTASKVNGLNDADEYQSLRGSGTDNVAVGQVQALAVDDLNRYLYVGINDTSNDYGGLSVIGLASDSINDFYGFRNTLKVDELGNTIGESQNDVVSVGVSGSPGDSTKSSVLVFSFGDADDDSRAENFWIETFNLNLMQSLADLTGDNITKSTVNANYVGFINPVGGDNSGQTAGNISVTDTGDITIASNSDSSVNIGSSSDSNDLQIWGDNVQKGSTVFHNLTGILDVFIYDTTKDLDNGAWRHSSLAESTSWYNESLDDSTNGECNGFLGTGDDRCGSKQFPQKAILVVTNSDLYIFDASDNSPWMRFDQGGTDSSDRNLIGLSSANITSVHALNGKVYLSGTGDGFSISFIQDKGYTTWNRQVWYNGTISERNDGRGEQG